MVFILFVVQIFCFLISWYFAYKTGYYTGRLEEIKRSNRFLNDLLKALEEIKKNETTTHNL